jgi:hypothetical protein
LRSGVRRFVGAAHPHAGEALTMPLAKLIALGVPWSGQHGSEVRFGRINRIDVCGLCNQPESSHSC